MTEVIADINRNKSGYQFIIPAAPNLAQKHQRLFNPLKDEFPNCHIINGQAIKVLLASDMAVIASGTSTLQAALLGVPMVVIYRLSPLSYFLGRLLVKVRHFSLVNILFDKSLNDGITFRVKELLQDKANKENIIEELFRISHDNEYRSEMQTMLKKIRQLFINKHASLRVAELAEELYLSVR